MKTNKLDDVIDGYFASPVFFDLAIIAVTILINRLFPIIPFMLLDKAQQLNVLSNLIGTTVSLAGFILAALTIIVTFKSNLKVKGFEDSNNALEYFFSTNNYKNIVEVFKKSITELVIIFIVLYLIWLSSTNLSCNVLGNFLLGSVIGTITSIVRALYVLFNILNFQFLERR